MQQSTDLTHEVVDGHLEFLSNGDPTRQEIEAYSSSQLERADLSDLERREFMHVLDYCKKWAEESKLAANIVEVQDAEDAT